MDGTEKTTNTHLQSWVCSAIIPAKKTPKKNPSARDALSLPHLLLRRKGNDCWPVVPEIGPVNDAGKKPNYNQHREGLDSSGSEGEEEPQRGAQNQDFPPS